MADFQRILLLMDNRLDPNWGSQGTTTELVRLIQSQYPSAEIRGVNRHHAGAKKLARSLGYRLAPLGPLSGWKNPLGLLGVRLLSSGWRDLVKWPDLIVVNGEGTLHPQHQTLSWLPLMDWIRRKSGAPLWVVNCSIVMGGEQRELFEAVLGKADRIAVRELRSHAVAKELGWNVEQAADCVFLAQPDTASTSEILKNLGIGEPFAMITGAASGRDWPLDEAKKWVEAIRSKCPNLCFAASTRTDRLLHERICPEVPLVTEKDVDYRQLMGLIQRADLHFGGRYHPTLFAAMAGTPFIALTSNTHKMEGVMELLEVENQLFSHSDSAEILQAIERWEPGTRNKRVRERCVELKELAIQNIPGPNGTL